MANVYVRSGATGGGGTGADWANAYLTLGAALAAKLAGDDFWVSEDHAESTTSATVTLASPGTPASPCRIFCVDHAGSVPPVAANLRTTATVTNTGTFNIVFTGVAYCYGIQFTASSSTSLSNLNFTSNSSLNWTLEACKMILGGSNSASMIAIGGLTAAMGYAVTFINTTVKFASTGHGISSSGSGDFTWRDTASAVDTGGSIPANLFVANATGFRSFNVNVRNVDLSALSTGKNLVAAMTSNFKGVFERCKLDSAVNKVTTPTGLTADIQFINCSLGAETNYTFEKYRYTGTETVETTIVRTSPATEATNGTTPISLKLVSTANCRPQLPFVSTPLARWNDVEDTPITVYCFGTWGGGAVPNNDEIWMEVEYLSGSSSSLGSKATSGRASLLATATATNIDTSTWGGSTSEFSMQCTFTPNQKGVITARVFVGVASSTFYIDPVLEITGQDVTRAMCV